MFSPGKSKQRCVLRRPFTKKAEQFFALLFLLLQKPAQPQGNMRLRLCVRLKQLGNFRLGPVDLFDKKQQEKQ